MVNWLHKICGCIRPQIERGALMKRTFGRFMSLLLVLAMVLAMVPAALAANQAYSVEPDSTIKIKTSITGFTVTNWESSDESVATVAAVSGSKTEAIVTGKKASNTAIRITATGTLANGRSHSEYFTVYVRDAYTLTLALSNSNINGTVALNQGDTRTLTATVTVGSSGVSAGNLANCEVHFTSDNDAISVTPASAKVTASTVGNYTTYKVEATVKAEKVGGATLTAQVWYQGKDGMKPSTSATATKTIGFRVSRRRLPSRSHCRTRSRRCLWKRTARTACFSRESPAIPARPSRSCCICTTPQTTGCMSVPIPQRPLRPSSRTRPATQRRSISALRTTIPV